MFCLRQVDRGHLTEQPTAFSHTSYFQTLPSRQFKSTTIVKESNQADAIVKLSLQSAAV